MDNGWTREQEAIENGNTIACFECARANGHTEKEADMCNEGDLNCKRCPFRGGEQ